MHARAQILFFPADEEEKPVNSVPVWRFAQEESKFFERFNLFCWNLLGVEKVVAYDSQTTCSNRFEIRSPKESQ
jgi:hypothetical protein